MNEYIYPQEINAIDEDRSTPKIHVVHYPGLTLRDHIAIQAMQGFLSNPDQEFVVMSDTMVAKFSYNIADAMLAERAKGEKDEK